MQKNWKKIIICVIFSVFLFGSCLLCIFKPSDILSQSERRELASFPEFNLSTVKSGEFVENFEIYATERFPARDFFRAIKSAFVTEIFNKKDNNGIFVKDGHISKIDDEKNPEMVKHALSRFDYLYNSYLKDKNVNIYLSLVPDKNYFLAEKNGYPSLDYKGFIYEIKEKIPYMTYIDIINSLSLSDYYTTDTHWRQEEILDVAETLGNKMGADVYAEYEKNILDNPFYGVYTGQYARKFAPDEIIYLTNEILDNAKITYYDTGMPKEGELYNMKKAYGKDPYEMFLSGSTPLVTLENLSASTDKELVIFRDSFASSLAPLLLEGYKKITLVDIRYVQSSFVGNLVEFEKNCDVLFLYSTTLLNNSLAMR